MSFSQFQLSATIPSTLGTVSQSSVLNLGISVHPGNAGIARPCNSHQFQSVGIARPCNPGIPLPHNGLEMNLATSKKKGSFNWDWENGWAIEWASIAKFEVWCESEQLDKSIEFILKNMEMGKWLWSKKLTYVCSHQMSGGQKTYVKKHPDWQHKINSKKTGCYCQLVIKYCPHTLTILGCYAEEHNHDILRLQLYTILYCIYMVIPYTYTVYI